MVERRPRRWQALINESGKWDCQSCTDDRYAKSKSRRWCFEDGRHWIQLDEFARLECARLWGKTYRVGEEDASRRSSAYVDTGYIDEDGRRKREGGRRGEL